MASLWDEEAEETRPAGHRTHGNTAAALAGTVEASPGPGPYAHTSSCCGRWAGHVTGQWGTRDPSLRSGVCFSVTGPRTIPSEW